MALNIMYKKSEEDVAKKALAKIMLREHTIEIITRLIEEVEFFFLEIHKD